MEEPLPKDYEFNWHNNWWMTLLMPNYKYIPGVIQSPSPSAEHILNKLNLDIPYRDFQILITAFLDDETSPWFYLGGEDYKKLGLKIDSLIYNNLNLEEHSKKFPEGLYIIRLINGLNFRNVSLRMLKKRGSVFTGDNYQTSTKKIMTMYLDMIFNTKMMDNPKKATKSDLLDGKFLFKEIVNHEIRGTISANIKPEDRNIHQLLGRRYYYHIKYLEPISSLKDGKNFEYTYVSKGNKSYYRGKNGRPYKYHSFIISMNKYDVPYVEERIMTRRFEQNDTSDITNFNKTWKLQNIQPRYDSKISKILDKEYGDEEEQKYYNALWDKDKYKPLYCFIPDYKSELGWKKKRSEIIRHKFSLYSNDPQVIDVLKLTNEVNYLTKKAELDYFGDVQGLEVKSLDDIDISGFEVKSKPVIYLNWLKNKNPLRGEKE